MKRIKHKASQTVEDLDSMGLREEGEPDELAQSTLPLTVT